MAEEAPQETLFNFVTVRAPQSIPAKKAPYHLLESKDKTALHQTLAGLDATNVGAIQVAAAAYVESGDYVTRLEIVKGEDIEYRIRRLEELPDDDFTPETLQAAITDILGTSVEEFVASDGTQTRRVGQTGG